MNPRKIVFLSALLCGTLFGAACSGDDAVLPGDAGSDANPSAEGAGNDVNSVVPIAADDPGAEGAASGSSGPTIRGKWILSSLVIDGASVALPPSPELGMQIDFGQMRGNGGCNTFGGSVDRGDDGSLTVGDLSMTEIGCDLLDFEQEYVDALVEANRWEADAGGITFRSDTAELRYVPGAPAAHLALLETEWTLDTIFAGEGIARTASTPDMSQPSVVLTIVGETATLRAEGCSDYELAIRYEEGQEGPILAPDTESLTEPDCTGSGNNVFAALDGIINATGFTVNENTLTLIGEPGELVSFRG